MSKWVLDDYTGGPLDYATLGFRASMGNILSATAAPDARWSLNGDQGAAETVTRYTLGIVDPNYVEPGEGHVLAWSDVANAYVPTAPASALGTNDAAVAAIVANTVSATRAATDLVYGRSVSVKAHGVVGDGVTDDTAAIQALVDAVRPGSTGAAGATLTFPAGEYVISDTINFTKWSGVIEGVGAGNSPTLSGSGGSSTVIRWNGPNTKSMFKLRDYRKIKIRDLRLVGKDAAPPLAGIESNNVTGDGAGTSEGLVLENVWIGKWGWSTQGSSVGAVKAGVWFSGDNTNNDQFSFRDLVVSGCEVGVDIPNSQSIWGTIDNLLVASATVAGVRTSATLKGNNWTFDNCIKDVQINSTAKIYVNGWFSERSTRILDIPSAAGTCAAYVWGGQWRLMAPMTGSSDLFVNAPTMTGNGGVFLYGVAIVTALGTHPKFYMRSTGAGSPALAKLVMRDCQTTMTLAAFDVACTVSNAMEVDISCGNSLFLRRRYLGAQTLAEEGWRFNGFMEGVEMTAPSAPSADQGRLYFKDNGSGKTQLCVLFSSGVEQVIATQP